jgi:hypothetical protein
MRLAATAAAIALLATGCGGTQGASSHPSQTPSLPGTSVPSPAASPTAAASPASPAASPTPSASSPSATIGATTTPTSAPSTTIDLSAKSLTGITSPSGRIACLLTDDPATVRCDVQGAHWNVQTPANCQLAYGDSAEVGAGRANLSCHGDTVFGVPGAVTVPYGHSARYHDIVCASRSSGITCSNAAGHGFMVSREAYRLF